jgi:hypothetical protein
MKDMIDEEEGFLPTERLANYIVNEDVLICIAWKKVAWSRPSAPNSPRMPIGEGCGSSSLLATRVGTSEQKLSSVIYGE